MHLGQEINIFFNQYGSFGKIGLTIAIAILVAVVYKTLIVIEKKNINTYGELIEKTIKVKSNFVRNVIKNTINILLLVSFFIMVAGIAAFFKEFYNIDNLIIQVLILTILYCIFMKGVNGLVKINVILIPILIISIIILGIVNSRKYSNDCRK